MTAFDLAVASQPMGGPSNVSGGRTWTSGGGLRGDPLQGARVLVVEDEIMVAAMIEDALLEFGCKVLGPAVRVDDALAILASESIDAAVLDVNIAGEMVFPVADALAARGVPFVFATAYGPAGVTARHADHAVLHKPYEMRSLRRALEAGLQGRR